jgi:hypothetical protein
MPYLHWDTLNNLRKRNEIIQHISGQKHHKKTSSLDYPRHHRLGVNDSMTENVVETNISQNDAEYVHSLEKKRHQVMYRLLNISNNMPLHPRRSLDQYGHPFLEDMSSQDEDQVLYKCKQLPYQHDETPEHDPTDARDPLGSVLMVDQLWCWVVDSSRDCLYITLWPLC